MEVLWGNQFIYKKIQSSFYLTRLFKLLLFLHWKLFWRFHIVSWYNIQWRYHWRGNLLSLYSACKKDLVHDLHPNIYEGSWSVTDFCSSMCYLIWRNVDVVSHLHWNFISWIHDRFMRVTHLIFHAISLGNEGRFCWSIHIDTDIYGKVLKIVACLDSDVNEATNPFIEGTPRWVLSCFQLLSNKRCGY